MLAPSISSIVSTHYSNNPTSALTQCNIVLNSFKISKKASDRSWYKTPSTNVVMNTSQEVMFKKESLIEPENIHPYRPEETSQKSSEKRSVPKKKKKRLVKPSIKEHNPHLQAMVSIMICPLKMINSIFTQRLPWILLILIAAKGFYAASIPSSDIQLNSDGHQVDFLSFLSKGEENSSFITYETTRFDIQTFEIELDEVREDLFYGLESNCAMIPMWIRVCADAASSCQLSDVNIKTSENAIVILSQSLFSLSRICE